MGNPCPICIKDNTSNIEKNQRYLHTRKFFLRHVHYDLDRREIVTPSGQVWEDAIRSFVQHNQTGRFVGQPGTTAASQEAPQGQQCESDKTGTPAVAGDLSADIDEPNDQNKIHVSVNRFKCAACRISFITSMELSTHMEASHVRAPLTCDICGMLCKRKHGLVHHLRRAHTGDNLNASNLHQNKLEQDFLSGIKSLITLEDFESTCSVCKISLVNKEEFLLHCSEKHPTGNVSYEKAKKTRTQLKKEACKISRIWRMRENMKKNLLEKVVKGNLCPVCNTSVTQLPRPGRLSETDQYKAKHRHLGTLEKVQAHFIQHFHYDIEKGEITTTSGQVWSDVVRSYVQQYRSMESSLLSSVQQQLETQRHNNISTIADRIDDVGSTQSNVSLIKQESNCLESVNLEELPCEAVGEKNYDSLMREEGSEAHTNSDTYRLVSENKGDTEDSKKQKECANLDKDLLGISEKLNSLITADDFVSVCLVCKIRFRDNKAFWLHNKDAHPWKEAVYINGEKKMKNCRTACLECGLQFASHADLKTHDREHHGKTFTCDVCQMQLTTAPNLFKHKLIHEREKHGGHQIIGQKTYVCEVCGEDIIGLRNYQAHLAMHKGDPNPFKCPKCPSSFPRPIDLTNHNLATHKVHKERTHVCHECGKAYSRAQDLKRHMYLEHVKVKPKDGPLTSGLGPAGKVKIRKHGLYAVTRKNKSKKPETGVFRCGACHEIYLSRTDLTQHLETCHTDGLKCGICHNSSYKNRYQLIEHMMINHGGDHRPTCDVCNKTFSSQQGHDIHKTIHTGEKPFECDVCHQRFRIKSFLTIHYRLHTGEKPHVCAVCGWAFRQKGDLNGHMKGHKKKGEWPRDTNIKGEGQHNVIIDNPVNFLHDL